MAAIYGNKDLIVGGKYRLVRKIGSGSFGDIFLGINISNGEVNIHISLPNKVITSCVNMHIYLWSFQIISSSFKISCNTYLYNKGKWQNDLLRFLFEHSYFFQLFFELEIEWSPGRKNFLIYQLISNWRRNFLFFSNFDTFEK